MAPRARAAEVSPVSAVYANAKVIISPIFDIIIGFLLFFLARIKAVGGKILTICEHVFAMFFILSSVFLVITFLAYWLWLQTLNGWFRPVEWNTAYEWKPNYEWDDSFKPVAIDGWTPFSWKWKR